MSGAHREEPEPGGVPGHDGSVRDAHQRAAAVSDSQRCALTGRSCSFRASGPPDPDQDDQVERRRATSQKTACGSQMLQLGPGDKTTTKCIAIERFLDRIVYLKEYFLLFGE